MSDLAEPGGPPPGGAGAADRRRAGDADRRRAGDGVERRAGEVSGQPPAPPPRRWTRRLSVGHVVMLTAALAAVLLNYSVLRARDDTVRVAVASDALRAGTAVTPGSFEFVDVRVDDKLAATLLTPDRLGDIEGWVATGGVDAGELVRATDLQAPSAPAAQRAMSLPIDPTHAVAGALEAGDRVDVIEVREESARYLVTDTEVLAVGDVARGGLEGLSGFSVTLAVDDEAALRLAEALHDGALDVVRSTGAEAATPGMQPPGPGGAAERPPPEPATDAAQTPSPP